MIHLLTILFNNYFVTNFKYGIILFYKSTELRNEASLTEIILVTNR